MVSYLGGSRPLDPPLEGPVHLAEQERASGASELRQVSPLKEARLRPGSEIIIFVCCSLFLFLFCFEH